MKTQNQFTPGPWHYQQETDSRRDGYIRPALTPIQPGMQNMPAVARACHSGCGVTEMRANARLIAAAPDLIDALQTMLDSFAECDDNWQVQKARAALAKAKGD